MTKKKKGLKIAGIVLGIVLLAGIAGFFYVAYHPQAFVGVIQSALYTDGAAINPIEPKNEPSRNVRENGMLYVNDLKYGDTYPNSYLDITYPTENTTVKCPTIVYFHGGGYFGGDKAMGDPMAASDDSTYLFDRLVEEGYNFVNVNYVLVPKYHFPDPVIQMNEAFNYLCENAEELDLDMTDVIIFGQSAGAVMTSQYSTVLSNPEYAALYRFTEEPALSLSDIRCVVIDDAPLNMLAKETTVSLKFLIANYTEDSIFFHDKEKLDWYNSMNYLTADHPRCFVTAGTDDGFPYDMKAYEERLTELGVECVNFETPKEMYGLTKHGYLSDLKYDESGVAQDCYHALITFLASDL